VKVAIVNPPTGKVRRDERCQAASDEQTAQVYFPPNDLIIMAAIFDRAGHKVLVLDAPGEEVSPDKFRRRIKVFNPRLLLVSTTLPTMEEDLALAARLKQEIPGLRVVAKGGPFFVAAEETLKHYPVLDAVIRHEYDFVCRDLARGLEPGKIAGLSFRRGSQLVHNPDRDCRENLDELPLPARQYLDNRLYRSPESGRPLAVIQTGRGCPNHCVFCPAGRLSHYHLRVRSPRNILAEIKDCVENYGLREFYFNADTFTADEDWVVELCQGILDAGWPIHWGANSRVNTISRRRLEAMKRAGCWIVAFGVESGDPELLKRMKKGITPDQIREAVALCQEVGIKAHTFYCIGTPHESEATLRATLKLALDLDADFVDINVAYPLPATELWEVGQAEGLFDPPALTGASYACSPIRSHSLNPEELARWRRKILLRLALRPGYIARTLLPLLIRPGRLGRYLYYGARRFWRVLRLGQG